MPRPHQRPMQAGRESITTLDWTPVLKPSETTNDSDISFTVTATEQWHVLWMWVELITTATVGNRQLEIQLQDDGSDVIYQQQVGVTQAASLTYTYNLAPGLPDLTAVRDSTYLQSPLPAGLILPPSYVIRVFDNNAVDAAADDMTIQMMVAKRQDRNA